MVLLAILIKKGTNEAAQIISFNNPLKFFVSNDTVKNSLDFKLTKINGSLPSSNKR